MQPLLGYPNSVSNLSLCGLPLQAGLQLLLSLSGLHHDLMQVYRQPADDTSRKKLCAPVCLR